MTPFRHVMRWWIVAVIIILLFTGLAEQSVKAQGEATPVPTLRPVTDNEVNEISRGLYCPICQNVPLEVCTTTACERWREQVRDLLAQGKNEAEIRAYFIERFGAQTVGVPTNPVAQALTLGLPFALIGLVGAVIAMTLMSWRRRQTNLVNDTTNSELTNGTDDVDDYRARLEAKLKERE